MQLPSVVASCIQPAHKLPTQRNAVGLFDSIPQVSGKSGEKGLLHFVSYRQWEPTGTRWDCTSAATEAIFFSSLSLKAWSCFVSSLSQRVHAALPNPEWP